MSKLDEYRRLRKLELELREQVISTQSEEIEAKRIEIALQREEILFELTLDELEILRSEEDSRA